MIKCYLSGLLLIVKVSEVVAAVTSWFGREGLYISHSVPCHRQNTQVSFGQLQRLTERRGREHGPRGAAVAFSEDEWFGNGLLQSGAGV